MSRAVPNQGFILFASIEPEHCSVGAQHIATLVKHYYFAVRAPFVCAIARAAAVCMSSCTIYTEHKGHIRSGIQNGLPFIHPVKLSHERVVR